MRRDYPLRGASLVGLAIVALAASLVSATLALGSARKPSPVAPKTLYVAPGGSDAADCLTPATACASFDRGYHAASPGDVVELAGGTYRGPQLFSPDESKKSAEDVVLRPAPGAGVVVQCEEMDNCIATEGADHLTLRGVVTTTIAPQAGLPRQAGVALDRGSVDVTFADVDAGHVFIAAEDASVIGGDYGPTVDAVSKLANDVGSNIVIDGARFHDHREDVRHMECIALYGARGVVIRNSRFDTCAVFAIFSAPQVGELLRDVRIENNVFSNSGRVGMSAHVKLSSHGGDCSNMLVRNNTFVHENVISDCGIVGGSATGVRWIGNIFETQSGCPGGGHVFDYNVIESGTPCGAHDTVVGDARFVDREAQELHLRPDSPAVDSGSPDEFPTTDIDGDPRPHGRAPDAGADEVTPLPSLSVSAVQATEGAALEFRVKLSAVSARDVLVRAAAVAGSATGADFVARDETVRIPAGHAEASFPVQSVQDALDEPAETLGLELSVIHGAEPDAVGALGTIEDDDAPPAVSVRDARAAEGSALRFPVELSAPSGQDVRAWLSTSDGTAKAPGDYAASRRALVTIPAGSVRRDLSVSTAQDAADEPVETLGVTIVDLEEASPGDVSSTGAIVDDDEPHNAAVDVHTAIADGIAPALRVRSAGRATLNKARRAGLAYLVSASEPCALVAKLLVTPRKARQLGLANAVVGRARLDLGSPAERRLVIRLTRRAVRALRGARRLRLTLHVTATDGWGNARILERPRTLRG